MKEGKYAKDNEIEENDTFHVKELTPSWIINQYKSYIYASQNKSSNTKMCVVGSRHGYEYSANCAFVI